MSIFRNKIKFLLILVFCMFLCISVVGATDFNATDNLATDVVEENIVSGVNLQELAEDANSSEKQIPYISVDSSRVTTGDSIEISLKDSNNASLINKNLTTIINNEKNLFVTNDEGKVSLKLDLPAKSYVLQVLFNGDDDYEQVNTTFNIQVLKLNSVISPVNTTVTYGNNFYFFLKDINGVPIDDSKVTLTINGKTYSKTTNIRGLAALTIKLNAGTYSLKINYAGNEYVSSITKTININVLASTSVVVGNNILLTNGYLRIYLKSNQQSLVSNKNVKITINGKVFTKKSNSEGIIVFKPNVGTGKLSIDVELIQTSKTAGFSMSKTVNGIKGNAKNPLTSKIPLKNGVPNVDYMTGSFVMADGDMKYTLLKSQYREVIKRDSYCLYLNKKLSKYVFFKSKAEPKLNHIIKREKWNVIERALNTQIVKKNKNGYWPKQITVSLKGKSYTYSEVRDVQDTGYTCGPTSCSMCSQALRNYYCESYLSKKAGTSPYYGSSTRGLKNALDASHFKCSIYYKSSFNKALKQLKKGGCALVFHTWNHYTAILDISKDGKKVLVGNPSGDYDHGSHAIPTKWLTVKYMYKCFNNYDTSGLIVKLKYNLNKATKKKVNNFYSSMGTKWSRQNVNERIPQI